MAIWGLFVAGALAIGSLPFFIGLAVVMPVLGGSTWHLYRRVVEPDLTSRPEFQPRPKDGATPRISRHRCLPHLSATTCRSASVIGISRHGTHTLGSTAWPWLIYAKNRWKQTRPLALADAYTSQTMSASQSPRIASSAPGSRAGLSRWASCLGWRPAIRDDPTSEPADGCATTGLPAAFQR